MTCFDGITKLAIMYVVIFKKPGNNFTGKVERREILKDLGEMNSHLSKQEVNR